MRRVISSGIRYGSSLHAMLIDFSKAFDRISRKALCLILQDVGIDYRMVERLMDMLTHTIAFVKYQDLEESWEVKDGVRQGCPLGPVLFLVVLGYLMQSIRCRFPSAKDLEYADDLTIIDGCREVLKEIFEVILNEEGPCLGLIVNKKKTEYIDVNNGVVEKPVKLLGTWTGEEWSQTVARNRDKAHNSYLMLYGRLWRTSVSTRVKVMVFFSVCVSILLYGLESLPLTATRLHQLNSFAYLCLRSILGYRYYQHISYELIEDNCKQLGIEFSWPSEMLVCRRRRDYWHFFRHHTEYAILGVKSGLKVSSRVWTLDRIVCKEEGIKPTDLLILSKHPEVTKGCSDMVAAVARARQLIEEDKAREKQRLDQELRDHQERLEQEKEREHKRKLQEWRERQEAFKRERELLIKNRNVFILLGEFEQYNTRLKELNSVICI
jgi:hypothetical protein